MHILCILLGLAQQMESYYAGENWGIHLISLIIAESSLCF